MAKNKMKEVAKLLGVELEEEFRIEYLITKYKLSKDGLKYWSGSPKKWNNSGLLEELIIGELTIIKLPKPILDEKEKEYLSNVIKPFRDKVFTVSKQIYGDAHYIQIRMSTLYRNTVYEFFNLPSFKPETMYKGMEINKKYTLEELGL